MCSTTRSVWVKNKFDVRLGTDLKLQKLRIKIQKVFENYTHFVLEFQSSKLFLHFQKGLLQILDILVTGKLSKVF